MNSRDVQFAVLKLLNITPRHGYGIYTELKKDHGIKNPSELYKLIRNMKENKLLKVSSKKKESGRLREVLDLTEDGLALYYEELLASARSFTDLLMELMIKVTQQGFFTKVLEEGYEFIFNRQNSVLIDANFPIERQLQFFRTFFGKFTQKQDVYINISSPINFSIEELNQNLNLHIIDNNILLKPNTMDIVVGFNQVIENQTQLDNWANYLKPSGTLLISLANRQNSLRPQALTDLINVLVELVSQNKINEMILDQFVGKFIQKRQAMMKISPKIDVHEYLEFNFKKVRNLSNTQKGFMPLFKFFIASEKKQNKD